jgi:hypothetical protein
MSQQLEKIYPEIKVKRLRARLSFTLFVFSGVLFGTMPFLGPQAADGQHVGFFLYLTWLLPIAFFVVFIRARMAVSFIIRHVPLLRSENERPMAATIYLSNFNIRSGRGFSYRVVQPGELPTKGLSESGEFVYQIGYSEKGGEPLGVKEGKQLFNHSVIFGPQYRKLDIAASAYYRPGATRPFMLKWDTDFRIWLNDKS